MKIIKKKKEKENVLGFESIADIFTRNIKKDEKFLEKLIRTTDNSGIPRTLKELGFGKKDCSCVGCSEGMGCDIKLIRAEAIKWIKYKRACFERKHDKDDSKYFLKVYAAECWIKHFFGITEEDLN